MSKAVIIITPEKALRIVNSKSFITLVNLRNSIRYLLAYLVVAIHAFFIGGIAFYNEWFAQPITANSVIPNGILYTVAAIILMLLLEYVYILISEKKLDVMQQEELAKVVDYE